MNPVFTVGHSTLDFDEFASLLLGASVTAIVDVRKLPGSRSYPWFNDDHLRETLPDRGISYSRLEGLTGRRPVSTTVPFEVNATWRNRSFHNYADHALGSEFGAALDELISLAESERVAVMCSEAVWWRCHRRLIADQLIARGLEVRHIMGRGTGGVKLSEASLTEGAVVGDDGLVRYPVTG